jgi:undecaprenyl-diphosphatase
MTVLMSLFLGIIQGITEFIPVSSSGHLAILQNIFRIDYGDDAHLLFEVLLHLGTLGAIFVVYRKDIKAMITEGIEFLQRRNDSEPGEPVILKPSGRTLLFIIIGTLPMFVAVFFASSVGRLFFYPAFIGFALLITGGLLYVSEKYIKPGNKTEKTMSIVDALIIGLAQAVAIIPGLSRSGTTISVGIARGLSRNFAVRYSLLLSIPAILGATVVTFYSAIRGGAYFFLFPVYLAGAVLAGVVGYFSIHVLRRVIVRGGATKFAYYCWGMGALTIILSLFIRN